MDKLQYDNLYKFLVSLGIVLIVLPIAAAIYLLNMEPLIISQADYESLSEASLQMLAKRDDLTEIFFKVFPWIAGIFFLLGTALLLCGIWNWKRIQGDLDKKLGAEATIQVIKALKMSKEETTEKAKEEVKSTNQIVEVGKNEASKDVLNCKTRENIVDKYIEIENRCYSYFVKRYAGSYKFERNIRIGKYSYDFIGVSQSDNIDLVVEIKYFKSEKVDLQRLYAAFDRLYSAGVNYETVVRRNFRCIGVIVAPKKQLKRIEASIATYRNAYRETATEIEVKCIAEETL